MSCKIYTLEHPKTGEIRYVGKTEESLPKRLTKHIYESKGKVSHRNNWVKNLLNQNLKPVISLLEEVKKEDWIQSEKYWIAQFKAWNFRLVNTTKGGDSVYQKGDTFEKKYGIEKAREIKEKQRQSQLKLYTNGYINPMKGIIGEAHPATGRVRSEETINKWRQSRKGFKHTEETKLKISISKTKNK